MTKSTHKQSQYRQRFIESSGYPSEGFAGIEQVWWRNPTNHNSLRLSKFGFDWVTKHTKLKFIEVKLSHDLYPKHLLQLERLMQEPYHVKKSKICLLGEADAIMLQLHAGNLGQYLDNLQVN